jgi:hypothetical protein
VTTEGDGVHEKKTNAVVAVFIIIMKTVATAFVFSLMKAVVSVLRQGEAT